MLPLPHMLAERDPRDHEIDGDEEVNGVGHDAPLALARSFSASRGLPEKPAGLSCKFTKSGMTAQYMGLP